MITPSVVCATAVWLVFLVWYTLRAKWWRDPVGRNAFFVSVVVFWLLLRATLVRLWPGFWEHEVLGALVYVLAALAGAVRIGLMEKSQREKTQRGRLEPTKGVPND